MGKHEPGLVKEILDRLDAKMAIGESRHAAKEAARREAELRGEAFWSFSTEKIHSYQSRAVYQEHSMRFAKWAREHHGVRHLADLDARADELATVYLQQSLTAGKAASTLRTERSALRMLFSDRQLAEAVELPQRRREEITRSRLPAARDRHFQPANWTTFLNFQRAAGLRRDELKQLRVADIHQQHGGACLVRVRGGKGGKLREVPVVAGREQDVLQLSANRKPDEKVFAKLPDTDLHSYRREYAQALYRQYAPGRGPLPATGRLKPQDYDREAALAVSRALGHNRLDVVLRNYLR